MSKKPKGDQHEGQEPEKIKKRIFLFSDGTGNAASTLTKTNVWRMYQALEKGGSGEPIQVALYDNGVGTSSFRPITIIAGIFGFGLKRNVLDLYRFLCLHYEEGAEIYLFGFSRGAFTMRLLAGMVGLNGIIKVGPENDGVSIDDVDRAGKIGFQKLSELFPARNIMVIPFRKFRDIITRKFFGKKGTHFEDLPRHADNDITFMGLFDTVSAYGGPVQEFTDAFSWLFFPTEPVDWSVGTHVRKVCHALALDEPRHSFWPKLINESTDPTWNNPTIAPALETGARIEQVWFAGAHAHVGGGYANDGLSMIPLNWMLDKLRFIHGVRFDEDAVTRFELAEDCCAPLADPRDGTGFIYRYNPRNLSRMTEDPKHHIYTGIPKIHHSVFDRMKHNPDYAPIAINRNYEIVDKWKAEEHHAVYDRKVDFHLDETKWTPQDEEGRAHVPDADAMNPLFTAKRFNAHVEAAWDVIWKRRVVFSLQMILMFLLIASPWLLDRTKNSDCAEILCFLREPVKGLASILPGPTQPWADVFNSNPGIITLGLFLFAITIITGRSIRHGINISLIDYWHYLVGRTSIKPPEPSMSRIYKLRTNSLYRRICYQWKHAALTIVFGLFIVGTSVLAINQTLLYIRDRSAPIMALCNPPIKESNNPKRFLTTDFCVDTGVKIIKGERYEVRIVADNMTGAPVDTPWLDRDWPASPNGLKGKTLPVFDTATLFNLSTTSIKRHPFRPLFTPIMTVGQRFPVMQKLEVEAPWPTKSDKGSNVFKASFIATESGRAYFYLNDAAIGFSRRENQRFYNNNSGGGTVHVIATNR